MFLVNTFQHRYIHRYTWRRVEGTEREQKSLIDYVVVNEKMRTNVVDTKVVSGVMNGSDQHVVTAKTKVKFKEDTKGGGKSIRLAKVKRVKAKYTKELQKAALIR